MDTGAVRPLPVQYSAPAPRAPEGVAPVAATDLPETQTVTAGREAHRQADTQDDKNRERSRNGVRDDAEVDRKLKQKNFRDKDTDTFVFRAVDEETGEVVRQIPEEAMLRLRKALADSGQPAMKKPDVNRTL